MYYFLCDGGDVNRTFIRMHFENGEEVLLQFTGYNMLTEEPMVFNMDCKVNDVQSPNQKDSIL